jgi:hypothetical protein
LLGSEGAPSAQNLWRNAANRIADGGYQIVRPLIERRVFGSQLLHSLRAIIPELVVILTSSSSALDAIRPRVALPIPFEIRYPALVDLCNMQQPRDALHDFAQPLVALLVLRCHQLDALGESFVPLG